MNEPPKPNTAANTSSAFRFRPPPCVEDGIDPEQAQRDAEHEQDRQVGDQEQADALEQVSLLCTMSDQSRQLDADSSCRVPPSRRGCRAHSSASPAPPAAPADRASALRPHASGRSPAPGPADRLSAARGSLRHTDWDRRAGFQAAGAARRAARAPARDHSSCRSRGLRWADSRSRACASTRRCSRREGPGAASAGRSSACRRRACSQSR